MSELRSTFETRKKEIQDFIYFTKFLEFKELSLNEDGISEFHTFFHPAGSEGGISLSFQDIINISKSNLALMIYSIIEYTVANSIDLIYEKIRSEQLSYSEINNSIREIWRKTILKSVADPNASLSTFLKQNEKIINSIITNQTIILHSRDTLPAGNLDGPKIKDTFYKHGIKWCCSHYRPDILSKFKSKRNELAHGSVSFIEALRDSTISTIDNEAAVVITFLEELLQLTENYINYENYKQATSSQSQAD